ncbi:hypothetical protein ACIBCT_31955 [Streptosporangium sp. NPDC050855]|uniref:hypothetical protein n=1 Tax=Streptosporangium sp. NPDC050855 TaxID=3366194 RepID=UPI00379AA936
MAELAHFITDLPGSLAGETRRRSGAALTYTYAEGGDDPTTLAIGEEGDDGPTTYALGEEGDDHGWGRAGA